jgi:hypothetical protein
MIYELDDVEEARTLGVLYAGEFDRFKPMTGDGARSDGIVGLLLRRARRLLEGRTDDDVMHIAQWAEISLVHTLLPHLKWQSPDGEITEFDEQFFSGARRCELAILIAQRCMPHGLPIVLALAESSEPEVIATRVDLLASCALVMISRSIEWVRLNRYDNAGLDGMDALEMIIVAEHEAGRTIDGADHSGLRELASRGGHRRARCSTRCANTPGRSMPRGVAARPNPRGGCEMKSGEWRSSADFP